MRRKQASPGDEQRQAPVRAANEPYGTDGCEHVETFFAAMRAELQISGVSLLPPKRDGTQEEAPPPINDWRANFGEAPWEPPPLTADTGDGLAQAVDAVNLGDANRTISGLTVALIIVIVLCVIGVPLVACLARPDYMEKAKLKVGIHSDAEMKGRLSIKRSDSGAGSFSRPDRTPSRGRGPDVVVNEGGAGGRGASNA